MELTREKAVELLNSTNYYELHNFLYEYCIFNKKDINLTNTFLQLITKMGGIKSLVNSTVLKLSDEQQLHINKVIILQTNHILKYF